MRHILLFLLLSMPYVLFAAQDPVCEGDNNIKYFQNDASPRSDGSVPIMILVDPSGHNLYLQIADPTEGINVAIYDCTDGSIVFNSEISGLGLYTIPYAFRQGDYRIVALSSDGCSVSGDISVTHNYEMGNYIRW